MKLNAKTLFNQKNIKPLLYLHDMKFKIFSELSYEVFTLTTFFFNIQVAKCAGQHILEESLSISPDLIFSEYSLKDSDARFIKMQINYGNFTITYQATVEVEEKLIDENTLITSLPLIKTDHEVLPYISPSRHCESDKLIHFAQKEFGHLSNDYEKANAISDWIFKTIAYRTASTNSSISACDTLISREGVCKDFAHLGIALCRAMDIPARYFSGYASNLNPPDIHACFEAYLGGQWINFDATHLSEKNGLVKISNGKDASEIAVATYYGQTNCTYMNVQCDIVE